MRERNDELLRLERIRTGYDTGISSPMIDVQTTNRRISALSLRGKT